jgi:hypothetical protein
MTSHPGVTNLLIMILIGCNLIGPYWFQSLSGSRSAT